MIFPSVDDCYNCTAWTKSCEDLVEGVAEVFVLYITVSTLSFSGGNRVRLQWPLSTGAPPGRGGSGIRRRR